MEPSQAHPHPAIQTLFWGERGCLLCEELILNFCKKTDLQLREGMALLGKRGKC